MHISIEEAATLLTTGHVVAVPTETVYGLAALLTDSRAIANIFTLKGRPSNNPLIIHLHSASSLKTYSHDLPPYTNELINSFWPGPMTLVLPVIETTIPSIVRAGLPTAAFRIPSHPTTSALLQLTGPLVMPSANLSGRPSSTCREHVEEDFSFQFPVIDGGCSFQGMESTILIWQDNAWVIIRLGSLAPEAFFPVLGYCPKIIDSKNAMTPLCPGQLYRHYAPLAKLFLGQSIPTNVKVVIGFDDRTYKENLRVYSLGISTDPTIASQRLYAILRRLDEERISKAWVDMDFPENGLWLTIRERLLKAAS